MLKTNKFRASVFRGLLYIILSFSLISCEKMVADKREKDRKFLHELGTAFMIYAQDDEFGRYPPADSWCDEISEILEGADINNLSSLAINPYCSSTSSYNTVLLFEAKTKGWNQYGGKELISTRINEFGKEFAFILFKDGHCEEVRAGQLENLKFTNGSLSQSSKTTSQMSTEVVQQVKKLAENGNAAAQFNLGLMYAKGDGVLENDKEAVEWYTKSAEQGVAAAQYNLGWMYANGKGVYQNYKEAVKWYTKAAEQEEAIAQYNLAAMYAKGEGVYQNYKEAVKWYTKAAEHGHANAQFNLAAMYDKGEGIYQNYKEAIRWYNKAAKQGHAGAQFSLSYIYGMGKGVNKDFVEAYKWIVLAGVNGKYEPKVISSLSAKMTFEQIEEAKKRADNFVEFK